MDLNLYPLARTSGQDQANLPGMYIPEPPRRTARGRSQDRLALYLTLEGNASPPAEQMEQLLKRLSHTYYNTIGSVTAAMRAVAESLNQFLLERNLRGSSSGRQAIGILTILTLREERLVVGMCGPVQAFLVKSEAVEHYYDPQGSRRGLGLGRATPIFYAQAIIQPNDALVVSPQPPATWTMASLAGLHGQNADLLRTSLLNQAGLDLNGLLVFASQGSGKISMLRPKPGTQSPTAAPVQSISVPVPAPIPEQPVEADTSFFEPSQIDIKVEETLAAPSTEAWQITPPVPAEPERIPLPETFAKPPQQAARESQPAAAIPVTPKRTERRGEIASAAPPPRAHRPARGSQTANRVVRTLGAAGGHTLAALRALLRRMLPDEELFTLPTPVMALTAFAIPLVVVTIASVVYFQRGRSGQYQALFTQAVQAAEVAQNTGAPQEQLRAWGTTLGLLDQADAYQVTTDSRSLRDLAQQSIDTLGMVQRLDYQPAITGGLPSNTRISHIASTNSDLYLLDANSGDVLRAFSTGKGYELDGNFQCGPGQPGSLGTGDLIDLVAFTDNASGGVVMYAMDPGGNLLQCQPGAAPVYIQLIAPYTGWGQAVAFAQDSGDLYILDPGKNAVWVYRSSSGKFPDQPAPFFTGNAPNLQTVVDISVEKDDLYLLHSDGHMTLCTFSGYTVSPTSCNDPLPYTDMRPGLEGQVFQPVSALIQVEDTQPPEPSIYLLQSETHTLYHFSLRLTFQRQLNPLDSALGISTTSKPATAFAISPDKRLVFVALENEIYYAGLP